MAVTITPAQNMSDIGRGPGDKHINWATDEVQQNNACYCWHSVTRKKPVSLGELWSEDDDAIKTSLFKHKPVFGILVFLTGSLVC